MCSKDFFFPHQLFVVFPVVLVLRLSLEISLSLCVTPPPRPPSVCLRVLIVVSLCRLAAQEYIRRQLEEEQRQLEILQQQLLQEQALLLVMVAPSRAADAPTHLLHLCCVPPPIPTACTIVAAAQRLDQFTPGFRSHP